MQTDADAGTNQMLALRGNECFFLLKYRTVYIQKFYNYFPSEPEQVLNIAHHCPISPCIGRAHQGLQSHCCMAFNELGLEDTLAS